MQQHDLNLSELPKEVLEFVFSHLDIHDFLESSLCCHYFWIVSQLNGIWIYFLKRYFPFMDWENRKNMIMKKINPHSLLNSGMSIYRVLYMQQHALLIPSRGNLEIKRTCINLTLLGARNIGKSQFLRLTMKNYNQVPSIVQNLTKNMYGTELLNFNYGVKNKLYHVKISVPNIEDMNSVNNSLHCCDYVMLGFDCNHISTINDLKLKWIPYLKKYLNDIPVQVLGFKADLLGNKLGLNFDEYMSIQKELKKYHKSKTYIISCQGDYIVHHLGILNVTIHPIGKILKHFLKSKLFHIPK